MDMRKHHNGRTGSDEHQPSTAGVQAVQERLTTPVCVTGGSGFLGSWCVKLLLERGYTVHTTTRSKARSAFLNDLPGAESRLKIFDGVDLLAPGSFADAIRGCDAVLHTASPFFMQGGTEAALVTPAVEGTRNVLTTCRELGVKKVALTSSTAAVYVTYGSTPVDYVFSDADWSPEALLREKSNWYCLSKTLAEKLAWEMSREEGCPFQLAVRAPPPLVTPSSSGLHLLHNLLRMRTVCTQVLNPTLILGPMLRGQPLLHTSAAALVASRS
jgi:nucleoside-diphosphate-sugar epimerase